MTIPPYSWFSLIVFLCTIFLLYTQAIFPKHQKPLLLGLGGVLLLSLLLDNWATQNTLWRFSPEQTAQFFLQALPIEKIILSLSLFFLTVVFFEHFNKEKTRAHDPKAKGKQ
ncbi:MAG: hypothetical protein J4215_05705 [Candidatus Diapherotrites archaeon]|uniref:Lycopene cyclase domain-containing protein n=1 Tax=Candidatus Iainarchaeum sp. TaxID=3101447 RepID=A0A8T4LBF7_9ARCH|nr:hypothetical protein [Candidatus Diapherotrites archaeon]